MSDFEIVIRIKTTGDEITCEVAGDEGHDDTYAGQLAKRMMNAAGSMIAADGAEVLANTTH